MAKVERERDRISFGTSEAEARVGARQGRDRNGDRSSSGSFRYSTTVFKSGVRVLSLLLVVLLVALNTAVVCPANADILGLNWLQMHAACLVLFRLYHPHGTSPPIIVFAVSEEAKTKDKKL